MEYRRLLDDAVEVWGLAAFGFDHDSGEVELTPLMRELFGFGVDEPVSLRAIVDRVHPDDRERILDAWGQTIDPRAKDVVEVEVRVCPGGDALRWVRGRARTEFCPDTARPRVTRGSLMDVTAQVLLAIELETTRRRLEEAVRVAGLGVFEHDHVADPEAEDLYVSPSMLALWGGYEEKPSLASFLSHLHPDDRARVESEVHRAHQPDGDGDWSVDFRFELPDGGTRWIAARSTTTFGQVAGERVPLRTIGAQLDITERVETALARQERVEILDGTSDFVASVSDEGQLLFLNRAARTFLGLGPDDPLDEVSIESWHALDSLAEVLDVGIPAAMEQGSWRGEATFRRHDGALVPMSQVLIAHRDATGEVARWSTIARDLSRERELEARYLHAQKMEAVGRLAGGVAHDFNNILSVIMCYAGLAEDAIERGEGATEPIVEIAEAAGRAATLTSQLLALSRRQVMRPRVLDLDALLASMEEVVHRLVDESIDVSVYRSGAPVRVKADPSHLEQIVLNLVVNARDAMEGAGCLTLEVEHRLVDASLAEARGDLKPGSYAVIAVSDTGAGMDETTRARIFEPFFTTKPEGKGTGLGLATVRGIVEQMGGAMSVYSEVGHGTTFKIYLPTTDEVAAAPVEATRGLTLRGDATILVADDEAPLRKAVAAVLTQAGYRVVVASGPLEAIALASAYRGPIDLLLTDVVMPQLSGRILAERLVKERPDLRVVYMSGYTENTVVHRGVLDDGIHFVSKPMTPDQLLRTVSAALAPPAPGPTVGEA